MCKYFFVKPPEKDQGLRHSPKDTRSLYQRQPRKLSLQHHGEVTAGGTPDGSVYLTQFLHFQG